MIAACPRSVSRAGPDSGPIEDLFSDRSQHDRAHDDYEDSHRVVQRVREALELIAKRHAYSGGNLIHAEPGDERDDRNGTLLQ